MQDGQYYWSNTEVASDPKIVVDQLKSWQLRFRTDAGVFSKNRIDYGSKVLIKAMNICSTAKVLDLGCGYGPIGLVAAKLAVEGEITMLDTNLKAVELTKQNALINGITNVRVMHSDMFSSVQYEIFDVILTNPPIRAGKMTVHTIFEQAYEHLNPGGALWVVIQKKQGAPSAKLKLHSLFRVVLEVAKDKGYRVYQAIK